MTGGAYDTQADVRRPQWAMYPANDGGRLQSLGMENDGRMTDDQQAIEKIRHGGRQRNEGVAELYRAYARRMLGYFMKHRVQREHAEELVNDVFINVVRFCEDFRGETRVDAWLWAIARNALIDHFRRARPEVTIDDDDLIRLADAVVPQETRSEGLEDCVRRAFAAFSAEHVDRAEVLKLVAFEGWDIGEIAAMLKRTPGATREYMSQCRKKLQAFLEPCRDYLTH